MVVAALRKAVSEESFPVLSLGGVGGLARKGPKMGATSTILGECCHQDDRQDIVTSRVVAVGE